MKKTMYQINYKSGAIRTTVAESRQQVEERLAAEMAMVNKKYDYSKIDSIEKVEAEE